MCIYVPFTHHTQVQGSHWKPKGTVTKSINAIVNVSCRDYYVTTVIYFIESFFSIYLYL